jgi:hypothetical protein
MCVRQQGIHETLFSPFLVLLPIGHIINILGHNYQQVGAHKYGKEINYVLNINQSDHPSKDQNDHKNCLP